MQGTGLWRASTDSKPMFCFSPTCTSACHRVFVPSQAPQHHSVFCTKWFVDPATATRLANPHKVEVSSQREDGLFFSFPIQAMIKFFERKQSLKNKISNMYEDMKQAVLECIDSCKAGKLQELDFLQSQMENFRKVILEGISLAEPKKVKYPEEQRRNISIALNSLITSHKFSIPSFKNTELFNISTFAQNTAILKQQIQKLGQNILKEIQVDGGYQRLQYEDMISVEVMLLKDRKPFGEKNFEKENDSGPETLPNLVNWQQSEYFIERSKKISDVKCPLCKFQFESSWVYSVGKPKSAYYDVLVKHLLEQHLLFLTLCYSHRISRTAVIQMPVNELIYLMTKFNYDQLDIYDGPNTKNLRYEPKPNCLSVVFVTDNMNIEQIEYSYCIANSPEEAAYKIVLLMEEVCVKMEKSLRLFNFKRNYYNLFSTIVTKYNLKCLVEEKYPPVLKTVKLERK